MKRTISFFLTMLMCLSLAGCGASKLPEHQQTVVDVVETFMKDSGDEMVQRFRENSNREPKPMEVIRADYLRLGNYNSMGDNAYFLVIALEGDHISINKEGEFVPNDMLMLSYNMDTGAIFCDCDIDWDSLIAMNGVPKNAEELSMFLTNNYHSYVIFGDSPFIYMEFEYREPLTDADIAAINNALK
jgi:predicted small lipoprotein YifL